MDSTVESAENLTEAGDEGLGPGRSLSDIPMLSAVGPQMAHDLLRRCPRRRLDPGEVLISPGEVAREMYVIVGGSLAVHLSDLLEPAVATLQFGEAVGELSALDGSPACAFVVAEQPSELLVVDKEAFWDLIRGSHAFAVSLLHNLAGRIRANNKTVTANVRERERFERAAMFDGLTGIHNRRWFDDAIERLVRRASFDNAPLSIGMIDVDHFKRFNDTYGHPAGDLVLRVVAAALSAGLRPTDLVARYGGEEFVIILPSTTLDGASIALDRLRESVASTPIPSDIGLPSVSISIGVATLRPDESVAGLLSRADGGLYEAKRAGRNRVFTAL